MFNPYGLARPLLFALDPEAAHDLTLATLDRTASCAMLRALCGAPVNDPVDLLGLRFANRVGLAAGLDKNAAHIDALSAMGFGFMEVGTVTPRAQPGNAKPRMFRLPERSALINRMGFNNQGLEAFAAHLQKSRWKGVLGVNIGKNADTPIERATDDYLIGLRRLWAQAAYVTVNISSPNTQQLRSLQTGDALDGLLAALGDARTELRRMHKRDVPMLLKIAPDLDDAQIEAIAAMLVTHSVDGVIATNTTIARDAVKGLPHADELGGLSGTPVAEASNRVIRAMRQLLPPRYPIIGVGGILSGDDARAKLAAGADLVQLYTGLIYRGPALVSECARALKAASR